MTQKANPSVNRPAEAFKTAGAIAYGGHGGTGFVREGVNPTEISIQDSSIDETVLNAFNESSSSSSLDVTIDPGEAFVFGSWLCKDTQTTISLDATTSDQVVSVGWNKGGTNDVIIGLNSAFSEATGDTDQKIPLFSFSTDSTGVTSVTDERNFNQIKTGDIEQGAGSGLDADTIDGVEEADIYTDEEAQDAVGTITSGGDKVTTAYDDASNTLTINTTALDAEEVEDTVSALVAEGNAIATSYDDTGSSLTISVNESNIDLNNLTGDTDSISEGTANLYFTDERAQDAVGSILSTNLDYDSGNKIISIVQGSGSGLDADTVDGVEESDIYTDEEAQDAVGTITSGGDKITAAYDDAANTLTINTRALDEEEVEDTVNELVTGGNAITKSYDDRGNTLEISVSESNIDLNNLTGDTDDIGEGTANLYFTDERAQDAVGSILGTNLNYDDANNSITVVQGSGSELNADTVDSKEADDFVLDTGDRMSGSLAFEDDIQTLYGTNDDFSLQYNSTVNELQIVDETNDTVKTRFDKNGDVFIPNGDLDLGGTNTVTNLAEPVNSTDVATKEFTESVAQGLTLKDSVRVSNHDSNINLSSSTDPNPIDGITLNDGDRILLKHQNTLSENGIYNAVTATDPTTWVRSSDFDEDAEVVQGAFTFVRGGTHANESYVVITADPIAVGTDAIEFAQFAQAGQLSGGTNVSVSGDVINVSPQGTGSGLNADTVDGVEAAEISSDVSNNGTTVTSSATDLNFTTNLLASDDGDGTSTIAIELSDDETLLFGTNDDMSQRYDATNNSFRIQDEASNSDRLELEQTTGNLNITGTLTENNSL